MNPAERLSRLKPSPIRALSEGAPADAVPMGLGEPGWALPEVARTALGREERGCPYGPNGGLPELLSAVATFHGLPRETVMVACGSQGALFALFQAWVNPGDPVLVPDPGFLAYPALARLAGAEPVGYVLASDGSLDAEQLIGRLHSTPGVKIVVVNHPSNPTGAGASRNALAAVAAACEAMGVLLISDEVYGELHEGIPPARLRDLTRTGVALGSVSKAWGAPGLRVGWALGDPRWLDPARLVHAYMVTAPSRPSQRAAIALLEASATVLPEARRQLDLRWDALASAFEIHFGTRPERSRGGFYHWLRIPSQAEEDPMAFCLRLRDEGRVVVVPGSAFGEGGRNYVRISYGGDPLQIREGVRRLAPFWRNP